MSENILFSIVVPVYGVEEYLPTCVDSILKQTYTNIEIILVDDGSPDSCPTLCDNYAASDPRIRVIHKNNGGLISARKAGAEAATGDYICCVDGDDYITPDYTQKMAEQITLYNPDIVCCGHIIASPDKNTPRPLQNRYGFYSKQDIEKEIFPQLIQTPFASYFSPTLWAKAFRSKLYKPQQNKVNDLIKIGEDGACTIPCVYNADSICIIPDCLYYYRCNPTSMTKNGKAFRFDGPELIANHLKNEVDLSEFDFSEQMHRKIVHEMFTVVKSQFNRTQKYSAIVNDIKENLKNPIYSEAIEKSCFSGKAGRLAHAALKHKLFPLIWLFNKIS